MVLGEPGGADESGAATDAGSIEPASGRAPERGAGRAVASVGEPVTVFDQSERGACGGDGAGFGLVRGAVSGVLGVAGVCCGLGGGIRARRYLTQRRPRGHVALNDQMTDC